MEPIVILSLGLLISSTTAWGADVSNGADNFYESGEVTAQRVTFQNQYRMNVVGNLFLPKDLDRDARHPAIVVGHPMGAVKEQSANLYATKMAELGFATLSLDLSFWGESEGGARGTGSPTQKKVTPGTPVGAIPDSLRVVRPSRSSRSNAASVDMVPPWPAGGPALRRPSYLPGRGRGGDGRVEGSSRSSLFLYSGSASISIVTLISPGSLSAATSPSIFPSLTSPAEYLKSWWKIARFPHGEK